jgi:hypothetical protein
MRARDDIAACVGYGAQVRLLLSRSGETRERPPAACVTQSITSG